MIRGTRSAASEISAPVSHVPGITHRAASARGAPVSRYAAARNARAALLLSRARSSPLPEARRLRQQLVVEYMDVARSIASRFHTGHVDRADLEQVAYVGLVQAVERFDERCGPDLLAFVVPTVTGEIKRYVRDTSWSVRPPRALQELHLQVRDTADALALRFGRAPHIDEIAAELGVSHASVVEARHCRAARRATSLDAPSGTGSAARSAVTAPLGDNVASDAGDFDQADFALILARACRTLSAEDRRVLHLRFFRDLPQTEIARACGVSQMQVSRMLARVLVLLRESIAVNPFRV